MREPSPLTGNSPMEVWLEGLRRYAVSNHVIDSPDIRWHRSPHGVGGVLEPSAGGGGRVAIAAYQVGGNGPDYVTGRLWNGTAPSGNLLNIMKPYLLRRTPFDTKTIAYTTEFPTGTLNIRYTYQSDSFRRALITGTLDSENQQIIPVYRAGDIIYVVNISGTGDPYPYLDINADGRAWARV